LFKKKLIKASTNYGVMKADLTPLCSERMTVAIVKRQTATTSNAAKQRKNRQEREKKMFSTRARISQLWINGNESRSYAPYVVAIKHQASMELL